MQRIRGFIRTLLTTIHNNTTPRDRFLSLRVPHLANRNGRGDTHHGGRDEVLCGDAEVDVSGQDGAGDGGEAGGHGEVKLGFGHEVDVGADETCGFALADPRGGSGDDGFGTGDVHEFEEEPGAKRGWLVWMVIESEFRRTSS